MGIAQYPVWHCQSSPHAPSSAIEPPEGWHEAGKLRDKSALHSDAARSAAQVS
jgi:hypothetical protein